MNLQSAKMTTWLVREWVSLYTTGLPGNCKTARREEIDSDLWEQTQDAFDAGRPQQFFALHLLGRLLLGMPDDLFWRMEHSKIIEGSSYMNLAKYLIHPRTYLNLLSLLIGMLILFPIGIGAFVAAVVASVVPAALFSSVFIYKWAPMTFGSIVVDTFPEALAVSLVGCVLLVSELLIVNAIVSVLRRFVSVRIGNLRFGQSVSTAGTPA